MAIVPRPTSLDPPLETYSWNLPTNLNKYCCSKWSNLDAMIHQPVSLEYSWSAVVVLVGDYNICGALLSVLCNWDHQHWTILWQIFSLGLPYILLWACNSSDIKDRLAIHVYTGARVCVCVLEIYHFWFIYTVVLHDTHTYAYKCMHTHAPTYTYQWLKLGTQPLQGQIMAVFGSWKCALPSPFLQQDLSELSTS